MKNYSKKMLLGIVLILVALFGFLMFFLSSKQYNKNFVEINFKKYTLINRYTVLNTYSDNHQSYIEVNLNEKEINILQKRFHFSEIIDYKGKIPCEFIKNEKEFIYYIDYDGYGAYGYILFALEKKKNKLMVFEEYGE